MNTATKSIFDLEAYTLAAAAYRTRVTANHQPRPNEVLPVHGKLSVTLSNEALHPAIKADLLSKSRIDIPEFATERRKLNYRT
ncbi:MAG: hypothetical protein ABW202_22395 [Duganella sp.]